MTGMDTETLTGKDLDAEVARVLGRVPCDKWHPVNFGSAGGPALMRGDDCPHADGKCYPARSVNSIAGRVGGTPAYSAPDCSGLAPVLAWLERERPKTGEAGVDWDLAVGLQFEHNPAAGWLASYTRVVGFRERGDIGDRERLIAHGLAPTLPAAVCRLLVAWAARRANGTSGTTDGRVES